MLAHHIPTDDADEDLSHAVRDFGPYPDREQHR
jgi:hypothetical protein